MLTAVIITRIRTSFFCPSTRFIANTLTECPVMWQTLDSALALGTLVNKRDIPWSSWSSQRVRDETDVMVAAKSRNCMQIGKRCNRAEDSQELGVGGHRVNSEKDNQKRRQCEGAKEWDTW